jgi:hypothetical protein
MSVCKVFGSFYIRILCLFMLALIDSAKSLECVKITFESITTLSKLNTPGNTFGARRGTLIVYIRNVSLSGRRCR